MTKTNTQCKVALHWQCIMKIALRNIYCRHFLWFLEHRPFLPFLVKFITRVFLCRGRVFGPRFLSFPLFQCPWKNSIKQQLNVTQKNNGSVSKCPFVKLRHLEMCHLAILASGRDSRLVLMWHLQPGIEIKVTFRSPWIFLHYKSDIDAIS